MVNPNEWPGQAPSSGGNDSVQNVLAELRAARHDLREAVTHATRELAKERAELRATVERLSSELTAARKELQGGSGGGEATTPQAPVASAAGESAGSSGVMLDADGAMPRAQLSPEVVKRLRAAGFANTGGSKPHDARGYASFVTKLFETRRYTAILRKMGWEESGHVRPRVANKLNNLALAASYGVGVPTIYALWDAPERIDLSVLPDSFVIKSNRGAGSRGVLPLHRVEGKPDAYELADKSGRVLNAEEVVHTLTHGARLAGPWYAEELLVADVGQDPIPHDVKLYCFYGEVGAGFARRAPQHFGSKGWQQALRFHYFDGQGRTEQFRDRQSDPSIPLSPQLPQMLEAGARLSQAVPLPFVRVDLYGTTKGIVMGEITLGPGGDQYFFAEHDVRMGRMWERAQVRLETDLATGKRPYDIVAGDHSVPELLRPYLPDSPAV